MKYFATNATSLFRSSITLARSVLAVDEFSMTMSRCCSFLLFQVAEFFQMLFILSPVLVHFHY